MRSVRIVVFALIIKSDLKKRNFAVRTSKLMLQDPGSSRNRDIIIFIVGSTHTVLLQLLLYFKCTKNLILNYSFCVHNTFAYKTALSSCLL